MEAVREDIHKTFRDVEAFATVVDPETQPYASKYAARELLVSSGWRCCGADRRRCMTTHLFVDEYRFHESCRSLCAAGS